MERHEFEHIIGAAANVLGEDAFIVVGSQAILGPYPDAPPELLRSIEVDLFPKFNPERAIEIDGALGDGSPFTQRLAITLTASARRRRARRSAGKTA
jgi:hypothetical protein